MSLSDKIIKGGSWSLFVEDVQEFIKDIKKEIIKKTNIPENVNWYSRMIDKRAGKTLLDLREKSK